jgi:hypothetical protein
MATRQYPLASFLAIRPRRLVAALHPGHVSTGKDLVNHDVAAATLFSALALARVPTGQISRTLHRKYRTFLSFPLQHNLCQYNLTWPNPTKPKHASLCYIRPMKTWRDFKTNFEEIKKKSLWQKLRVGEWAIKTGTRACLSFREKKSW